MFSSSFIFSKSSSSSVSRSSNRLAADRAVTGTDDGAVAAADVCGAISDDDFVTGAESNFGVSVAAGSGGDLTSTVGGVFAVVSCWTC
jgi:hypothetical protein